MHMPLSEASSPPHDSYVQTPMTPYQPTCDDLSAEIALVGRLSSKVVSESERIELEATKVNNSAEEVPVIEEATDTGESGEILLPPSSLPPVKPASDIIVTGIYIYMRPMCT